MRAVGLILSLSVWLSGCSQGASSPRSPADADGGTLPVRRVRLYETGVGYFERAGTLERGMDSIALPASHVDDALKSLIVLSDGRSVRVSAVEFASVLSPALARVQAGLPTAKVARLSYPVLIASLRGVEVVVKRRSGDEVRGRLVDIEAVKAPRPTQPGQKADGGESDESRGTDSDELAEPPRHVVTVLAADGAVIRLDSAEVVSIGPVDARLAARLDSAIGTVSERGAQSARMLKVSAVNANTPVRLGYVTETPVFRVTYRLLFAPGDTAATLQGWVLVHNDTDEAWRDVALEIVNGRPDSFLVPLTAPRYLRRELSAPEEAMSTLPQLATRTADQIWGEHDDTISEEEEEGSGGLGLSGIGEGGGGQGFGSGHGRLGGSHMTRSPSVSSRLSIGNLAALAGSETAETSVQFRYRMREAISLSAHASALVPFTEAALRVEPMTRFEWGSNEGRAAARFTNISGQTLPEGPLAIYDREGLTGEATLPRLVAGRQAWLSYGADLDLEVVQPAPRVDTARSELVRFESGKLVEHYVRHREYELELANKSGLAKSAALELAVVDNARVAGADKLLYDADGRKPLAVFEVKPRTRDKRALTLDEGLSKSTPLADIDGEKLAALMREPALPAAVHAILKEAHDFVAKGADASKAREQKRKAIERVEHDSKRLEGTLEKLGNADGGGALPLTRRIVELEEQRRRLEDEERALGDAEQARKGGLAGILERLR